MWMELLPRLNACLNATSALCLLGGFVAIRRGDKRRHMRLMLAALASSSLFLAGYVTRMWLTGTHRFPGAGPLKALYLALLFSHMLLAIVLLPMLGRALFLAWRQRFGEHRAMARWAWPTWMYVSITGVVVYYMLYHLAPEIG
jgi:putative membrane protein